VVAWYLPAMYPAVIDGALGPLPQPALAWDPANPEWPAVIPDLTECEYTRVDCFGVGYIERGTGRVLPDDEVHELMLDVTRRQVGCRLFAMPLDHMAYDQALQIVAERLGPYSRIHRETARVSANEQHFVVRIAWLQTASSKEYQFGSASWTPERGKAHAATMREFERLNPGIFGA